MPRMIDLIRAGAVPPALLHSAARGGLSLPPREMLEILVYLASNSSECRDQASQTLAGWDKEVLKQVLCDSRTPPDVLEYFMRPENLAADLLHDLLEGSLLKEEPLAKVAQSASRATVDILLENSRICRSRSSLMALDSNPNLSGIQAMHVHARIAQLDAEDRPAMEADQARIEDSPTPVQNDVSLEPQAKDTPNSADNALHSFQEAVADVATTGQTVSNPADEVQHFGQEAMPAPAATGEETQAISEFAVEAPDEYVEAFLAEHAAEFAATEEKPYQAIGGLDELEILPEQAMAAAAGASSGAASDKESGDAGRKTAVKKAHSTAEVERGSVLQKIAKLDIKGRIQLAMRGNKEERSILVRDGTKLVALSVLDSPKITDGEVERFASQKNVLEALLRAIPMKRRFAKNYVIVRNLVFNPRTPIDMSLGLMKNLLVGDLKNLSGNKEVSDTIRKLALKMFKQKASSGK
jgi:hypothetical protein